MKSSAKTPLSVLIPAKNEIRNIRDCIASVDFADEVVVVDSASTDGTQEAAREMGADVINFKWNGRYPKKKNWALEHHQWRHEWVLILDADERITPELAREIKAAIALPDGPAGYYLNRRFMFMGRWIRHSGYFPSYNLRLFRHDHGRYERLSDFGDTGSGDNEVHEHVLMRGVAAGSVAYLHEPMLHFAYPDIGTWVEKHNRYSNWEACLRRRGEGECELKGSLLGGPLERKRWIKNMAARMPFRPTLRFLYHYVLRQGFRDGYEGYVLCRLMAFYEFLSVAKSCETAAHDVIAVDALKDTPTGPGRLSASVSSEEPVSTAV